MHAAEGKAPVNTAEGRTPVNGPGSRESTGGSPSPVILPYEEDERLLAEACRGGRPLVTITRPASTTIVLGRASRPETELHMERVLRDEVALLRRGGGGCAVLVDPGTVLLQTAFPAPGIGGLPELFRNCTDWALGLLEEAGLTGLSVAGICDLVRGDRKVGGACMIRRRDWALYGLSLLVATDPARMEQLLRHPPREPNYRRGRSHRDFVGTLGRPGVPDDAAHLAGSLRRIVTTGQRSSPAELATMA